MQVRLLVLLALSHGPKHGYEIARHIEERTGGICAVSFGALYPVLHRLEADGLAKASWRDGDVGKKRKVYALTRAGHAALAADRAELEQLVVAVRRLAEAS